VFFSPAAEDKHPGVLVLGWSEGGVPLRRAAWLASHGYAEFALCYFHREGTPPNLENIPLEYFGKALGWLTSRPEVAADLRTVTATSRGGELALQHGSMYPQIKAVVAYVPANVRSQSCCQAQPRPSWTWQGERLAWAAPRPKGDSAVMWRAAIPVEHTHGSIMVIGGEDDGVWPSAEMVDAVAARLRESHFANQFVVLNYPHAGHRAGLPEMMPAWHKGVVHPLPGKRSNWAALPREMPRLLSM
jgi:dienelactone hydrolase